MPKGDVRRPFLSPEWAGISTTNPTNKRPRRPHLHFHDIHHVKWIIGSAVRLLHPEKEEVPADGQRLSSLFRFPSHAGFPVPLNFPGADWGERFPGRHHAICGFPQETVPEGGPPGLCPSPEWADGRRAPAQPRLSFSPKGSWPLSKASIPRTAWPRAGRRTMRSGTIRSPLIFPLPAAGSIRWRCPPTASSFSARGTSPAKTASKTLPDSRPRPPSGTI